MEEEKKTDTVVKKVEGNDFKDNIITDDDFVDVETGEPVAETTTETVEKQAEQVASDKTVANSGTPTKSQTREENAYYAELRRKHEAEIAQKNKQIEEAVLKGELGVLKTNPFTQEAITDKADLEVYKLQKQIEENGGDPITDLPKAIAKQNREIELAKQKEIEEQNSEQQLIQQRIRELTDAYPNINLAELASDKDYQEFVKGKVKRWTGAEMYEGYLVVKEKKQKEAEKLQAEKVAKEGSKTMSKLPSSNPNGKPLTKNVLEMTDEEYKEHEKKNSPDFF